MKLGENYSCKPPGASYTAQEPYKQSEICKRMFFSVQKLKMFIWLYKPLFNPLIGFNKNLFKTSVGDLLTKLEVSKRFQPTIYKAFHEESESEVQSNQILQENLKM